MQIFKWSIGLKQHAEADKNLYSYTVYQIEGQGKNLFEEINGDKNTIMGLPILEIKKYLENIK